MPMKPEHLAKDGDYAVEVTLGKTVLKKYPLKVKDGAIVLHPRQAPGYATPGRALVNAPATRQPNCSPPPPRVWIGAK